MGLNLNISSCTFESCGKLIIYDNTLITPTPADGSNMWGDTVTRSGITSATIQITLPNGSDLLTTPLDVTSIVSSSTKDIVPLTIQSSSGDKFIDGIYTIEYIVVSGGITYRKIAYISIICNYQCCVDTLWCNLPSQMCSNCDFEIYLNTCFEAQSLLNALKCASCSGNTSAWDNISALLDKICDSNNCNC